MQKGDFKYKKHPVGESRVLGESFRLVRAEMKTSLLGKVIAQRNIF